MYLAFRRCQKRLPNVYSNYRSGTGFLSTEKKTKKKPEMAGFSIGSGLDNTFSPPGIQLSHLFPRI